MEGGQIWTEQAKYEQTRPNMTKADQIPTRQAKIWAEQANKADPIWTKQAKYEQSRPSMSKAEPNMNKVGPIQTKQEYEQSGPNTNEAWQIQTKQATYDKAGQVRQTRPSTTNHANYELSKQNASWSHKCKLNNKHADWASKCKLSKPTWAEEATRTWAGQMQLKEDIQQHNLQQKDNETWL